MADNCLGWENKIFEVVKFYDLPVLVLIKMVKVIGFYDFSTLGELILIT